MLHYFSIFCIILFLIGYAGVQFYLFTKKSKEFNRLRTKEEKIDLILNRIQPRVIHDGYREIKSEEDCYYSSLILEYQMAEIFGKKGADPSLSLNQLGDPSQNSVLANRQRMSQIENLVREELGENIQVLIQKLRY